MNTPFQINGSYFIIYVISNWMVYEFISNAFVFGIKIEITIYCIGKTFSYIC